METNRYHDAIAALIEIIKARAVIKENEDIVKQSLYANEFYKRKWTDFDEQLSLDCFDSMHMKATPYYLENERGGEITALVIGDNYRYPDLWIHEQKEEIIKRAVLPHLLGKVGLKL